MDGATIRNVQKRGCAMPEIEVYASSGNVFADMGLLDADALLIKAQLADRIIDLIEVQRLTEIESAELLGIDQSQLSALVRGRLSGFSTDRLFRFLNALGRDVEIRVVPNLQADVRSQTRVVSA
jgi:predicted XRE-type DNA-binding protein